VELDFPPGGLKYKMDKLSLLQSQRKNGTSNCALFLDIRQSLNHMPTKLHHVPASAFSLGGYFNLAGIKVEHQAQAAPPHGASHIEKTNRGITFRSSADIDCLGYTNDRNIFVSSLPTELTMRRCTHYLTSEIKYTYRLRAITGRNHLCSTPSSSSFHEKSPLSSYCSAFCQLRQYHVLAKNIRRPQGKASTRLLDSNSIFSFTSASNYNNVMSGQRIETPYAPLQRHIRISKWRRKHGPTLKD
jgi:hypothetical protein